MAVLPVEGDTYPKLVQVLNNELRGSHLSWASNIFQSKVSLEVVQLQIECLDQTPKCWSAAGQSLSADRLLFAQIEPITEHRRRHVKVKVTLFDARSGDVVGQTFRTFGNEDEAARDAKSLVRETLDSAAPPPSVQEAPVPP